MDGQDRLRSGWIESCLNNPTAMSATQPPTRVSKQRYVVHVECVVDGQVTQRMALLDEDCITFGRGGQNQVCFPATCKTVSANHAVLVPCEGGHVMRDQDSRNGLYLCGSSEPVRVHELQIEPGAAPLEVSLGAPGPICRIWSGMVFPFADYLVLGQLGQGGMARVFAAQDGSGLNRLVVLKVYASHIRSRVDPAELEPMLELEARLTGLSCHPNVVQIHRIGSFQGTPYIEMEYLLGVNLASIQHQLVNKRVRCPVDLAAALLSQACLGLHAAHEACDASGRPLEIVHRDCTPSNIMVLPTGDVKLIDFGVARSLGTRAWSDGGAFVGKVAYAAPEQISQPHAIDRRADLFAAGVIFYELLAGRPLFARETDYSTMSAVMQDPVPPVAGVSADVNALLQRLLARNPSERLASAASLAAELEQIVLKSGGHYLQRRNIALSLRRFGVCLDGPVPRSLSGRPTVFPPIGVGAGHRRSQPPQSAPSRVVIPSGATASAALAPAHEATSELSRVGPAVLSPEPHAGAKASVTEAKTQKLRGTVSRGSLPTQIKVADYVVDLGDVLHAYASRGMVGYEVAVLRAELRAPLALTPSPAREVLVYLIGAPGLSAPLPLTLRERFAEWHRFMAHSSDGQTVPALVPALVSGDAWHGGPMALLLQRPVRTWASILSRGGEVAGNAVSLTRGLFSCLAELQQRFPGFTHGELAPDEVALLPHAGLRTDVPELPCLLPGRWLDWLTTGEQGGITSPAQQPLHRSLYLAPECLRDEPPSPASDVFSAALMSYELLGGPLTAAVWALRQGGRLPALPPAPKDQAALGEAIVEALHPDPRRRPLASAFLRQCTDAPLSLAPAFLTVQPPPIGEARTLSDTQGRRIHLYSLLRESFPRSPHPVPFCTVPLLLPSAVGVLRFRGTLTIEIIAMNGEIARSRLYADSHASGTERLFLPTGSGSFEVGSRSQNCLQRIDYQVAAEKSGSIDISALGLRVSGAVPPCQAVLWTREPRTGDVHLCCVLEADDGK